MMKPLCFVLMPFGRKPRESGRDVDFESVYHTLIRPGIEAAGMEPIRADEERLGGIIHKPMFERLILCDFAVADLTTANPNVFYELGVRHATRPWSTVSMFANGTRLPFDLSMVRSIPYQLSDNGEPLNPMEDADALRSMLEAAKEALTDSPVFTLVKDFPAPDISRLKTDVFRDRVEYAASARAELANRRRHGPDAVRDFEREQTIDLADMESGVVIDLLLSYRAVSAWDEMVRLSERMSSPLSRTVLVREQRALALNRLGRRDQAEQELRELIDERGPSSETCGLLGRVYKDRWDDARQSGALAAEQEAWLRRAIDAYLMGFETDWRDAYPGVNAVTLMELVEPRDNRQAELLPVVEYAVMRRLTGAAPDYWDHATLVELAVLKNDRNTAEHHLGDALASMREHWEGETTARNLRLIREARARRNETHAWIEELERALASDTPTVIPSDSESVAEGSANRVRIFLSHSTDADDTLAIRIASELAQADLDVWVDAHRLQVGDVLDDEIAHAVAASQVGVVLYTPRAAASPWVKREIELMQARSEQDREYRVLFLCFEGLHPPHDATGREPKGLETTPERAAQDLLVEIERLSPRIRWVGRSVFEFVAERLDMEVSELTPAFLAELTRLDLGGSEGEILFRSIDFLAPCQKLMFLNLNFWPIESLDAIRRLHALEKLYLGGTRIRGVPPLAGLTRLLDLSVGDTMIGTLHTIAQLRQLESLHLPNCRQIHDWQYLRHLPRLRVLNLRNTSFSDCRILAELPLETLILSGSAVTDLSPLETCGTLRHLQIEDLRVTDLSPIESLEHLVDYRGPARS